MRSHNGQAGGVCPPAPFQQLLDTGRWSGPPRAHCQSSGRSTCSKRSTCPVRL
jgi:hypothetical protein